MRPHGASRSPLIRVNDKQRQAPAGLQLPPAFNATTMQALPTMALAGKSALRWVMATLILSTTTTTTTQVALLILLLMDHPLTVDA